ncbi:hypothetical protein AB0M61_01510 [Streptomyces sp. NPDC051642]|uniref:hypothetical protein n=1 Tax=Streptomyces sp. NPDC051642 TaxID=3154646 RepID=UPI003427786D
MPDPSTTRLALYKSKSDGSELVSYTQDIGQNWDRVDAAAGFQIVTSSTRPSTPYSGKAIAESDTGRLYYSNASIPASGSWVEIASNGASFTMTGTRTVTLNGTAGSAVKLATLVSGDSVNRLEVTADGTMNWGPGSGASDVGLARTSANTLGTLVGDHWKVGGDLKLVNGATTFRNALSAATTVANTLTQTAIATHTIPANDAAVGAVYLVRAWGTLGVTATPTITFVCKLGGAAGTAMVTFPAVTVRSGATDGFWDLEFYVVCAATGGSGTWSPMAKYTHNFLTSATTYTPVGPITSAPVTRDTTVSNDMVLCATWSAASASNTITCRGFTGQRIA